MTVYKVAANEIGVEPAKVRELESEGFIYFTWPDSVAVGAQCANCHAILWANQRKNVVLNERKPEVVPESGPLYREYREGLIKRFLASMPQCPECGGKNFDLFINNVNFPRFQSGMQFPENVTGDELLKVDDSSIQVYFVE